MNKPELQRAYDNLKDDYDELCTERDHEEEEVMRLMQELKEKQDEADSWAGSYDTARETLEDLKEVLYRAETLEEFKEIVERLEYDHSPYFG